VKAFRWMIVLPPVGFARSIGLSIAKSFQQEYAESASIFDTQEVIQRTQSRLKVEGDASVLDWVNQQLLVQVFEWKVTHLLCLSSAPVDPHYLKLLKEQGVFTVHWFYEDHRIADYWSEVASSYDVFCANQQGVVQRFCEDHRCNYYFLPLAAQSQVGSSQILWHGRNVDLAFVGDYSPYRAQALEILSAAGVNLVVSGEGWESYKGFLTRHINDLGMENFRTAKITLRLPMVPVSYSDEESPIENVYWESIAHGAFPLLVKRQSNAANLVDIQYREFTSLEELLAIVLLIRHDGIESSVIQDNLKAVNRHHTLNHRVRQLFDHVDDLTA
jgi:hypothetical protein